VKFTDQGGVVTVAASAAELADADGDGVGAVLMATPRAAVQFSISDTGVGIPDDKLTRIFDAFYQVDSSSTREHGGAGLGLSIVKRLVEAHGGEIRVESEVGEGTTFYVTIPELERDSGV
jgi:signal transduction histidine kinase